MGDRFSGRIVQMVFMSMLLVSALGVATGPRALAGP
jgi:hypothetical protein